MPQLYFYQIQKPWAQVILSNEGLFTAVSDYGNWGYKWSDFGEEDFQKFFLRLNDSYLLGKLYQGQKRVYDGEKTLKNLKEYLNDWLHDENIDQEFYNEEIKLIRQFSDLYEEFSFYEYAKESQIDRVFDFACYDYPYSLTNFVTKVIPEIKLAIKIELGLLNE